MGQELLKTKAVIATTNFLHEVALVTLDGLKESVHQVELALEVAVAADHAKSLFDYEELVVTSPSPYGFKLKAETVEYIADVGALLILVGVKSEDKCVLTVVLTFIKKITQLVFVLELSAANTCWEGKVLNDIFALFDLVIVELLGYLNKRAWLFYLF